MQGLARMLLEIDPVGEAPVAVARSPRVAAAATAAAAPAEAAPAASAAPAAPAPVAAPADDGPEEPWIDSVRCSTCNDCVNLNPLLFVYNENKQARIGNAQAGTYAQIVAAAEKCPSRCIHPGKPMNPAEPGLDALIARAQPFNR
jgi:ferredoxin